MTKTPEELKADWNAGKLEDGFYYVLTTEDNIVAIAEAQCGDLLVDIPEMILKILAPVPSYDEYKAMQEELAEHRHYCCCEENEVMRLKLAEMEELLKECLPIVSAEIMTWQIRGGEESHKRGQDLLTRINAALGESEEK